MPVTRARARSLALSLEDATEAAHFDRTAFRRSTIFATLAADGSDLNLMFDPDLRDFYVELAPDAFSRHPSKWGDRGATRCDLRKVDATTLLGALKAAHGLAARKKTRRQKV